MIGPWNGGTGPLCVLLVADAPGAIEHLVDLLPDGARVEALTRAAVPSVRTKLAAGFYDLVVVDPALVMTGAPILAPA